jgi:hypothetical protein
MCKCLDDDVECLVWMKRLSHQVELSHLQRLCRNRRANAFCGTKTAAIAKCDPYLGPEGEEANQLLAITGKIVKSQTLTIPFFRSLTSLNLIVSTLFT